MLKNILSNICSGLTQIRVNSGQNLAMIKPDVRWPYALLAMGWVRCSIRRSSCRESSRFAGKGAYPTTNWPRWAGLTSQLLTISLEVWPKTHVSKRCTISLSLLTWRWRNFWIFQNSMRYRLRKSMMARIKMRKVWPKAVVWAGKIPCLLCCRGFSAAWQCGVHSAWFYGR